MSGGVVSGRHALAAVREELRLLMLDQPISEERDTYSDGFGQGLAVAISKIDALLTSGAVREEAAVRAEALREAADELNMHAKALRRNAATMDADGMPSAASVDRLAAIRQDETAAWLRDRAALAPRDPA